MKTQFFYHYGKEIQGVPEIIFGIDRDNRNPCFIEIMNASEILDIISTLKKIYEKLEKDRDRIIQSG